MFTEIESQSAKKWHSDSIKKISFSDRHDLCIRSLLPTDREKVREYFAELSPSSKYNRYFKLKDDLTETELTACVTADTDEYYVIGIWACDKSGTEQSLIGTASYVQLNDANNSAEFAIIVADDWQNKGIGKHLMTAVLERAREADIDRMLVYFLPSNSGMKNLTRSMADEVSFKYDEGVVVADFHLEKDEVSTLFWSGEISEIWDNTFQSVIDMSFMPFTIYLSLAEENREAMDTLSKFEHISDFEKWMDSIENAWF